MVQFNFTYDPSISLEQRVGFELAGMIWSSYLEDDVEINLHIASSARLGQDGQAVGGAIPIFHEQNYGIYQEYAEEDADSDIDEEAIEHLQDGNTVDFLVGEQVVDGNTNILLTSAQAKALGMDEALELEDGGTWDRDLVDPNALDGYILVSNAFEWNYDYTRSGEAPPGTLDFMSMALHEIGHQLGFVSGLDGALELSELYSGETQAEGFTVLDLFRHSDASGEIDNPDGAVSDLTVGQNSYFSIDGGETNLGNFSNGEDYQASHWERLQVAMGIMDPTLAYQERTSLGLLDLQALDVLGWDVDYKALKKELDLDKLLKQAEKEVAKDLGLDDKALTESRSGEENSVFYTLGYGELWQIFEQSMFELGYGQLWSVFELGYGELWQEYGDELYELGYGQLWQMIEDNIFNLGYGQLWQQFETDMLELGYGQLWQQFETEMLELGYGQLWQQLDTFFVTVDDEDNNDQDKKLADGGVGGKDAKMFHAGDEDDIIAGDNKQDRIRAGAGDDLIDGEGGHDVVWGEAGRDIIYGQDGNDLLYGGEDDDLLLGENDDDELYGEHGDDILSGGEGDDILSGGEGKDNLKGGRGRDVLAGGEGDDRLEGEADNDLIIGGAGQDRVMGGSGHDVIYGDDYDGAESLKQLRAQLQQQPEENASTDVVDSEAVLPNNNIKPIRLEAEDMLLSGDYEVTTWGNDSGQVLKADASAMATTTFSGPSGNYMVIARYFDRQTDSPGIIDFSLNSSLLNSFTLDQNQERFYTRTVISDVALREGDEFSISISGEEAAVDYLEFVSLDNLLVTPLESSLNSLGGSLLNLTSSEDGANSSSSVSLTSSISNGGSSTINLSPEGNSEFRVEAETMTLLGDYVVEGNSGSSGGALISSRSDGEGIALTAFGGEAGYYNIIVGYYDENDTGIGQITAALNGSTLDAWSLDQNLGGTSATSQNFLTRTVASTVLLNTGDVFKLTGLVGVSADGRDEHARIDYVDFVKVDLTNDDVNPEPVVVDSEPVVIGSSIRIEAESMNLSGYSIESSGLASNNRVIRTGSSGNATTSFGGDTGYYNIIVAYYDENDGLATLSASLEGVELDEWQLDQSLGSNVISSGNLVRRTIATQVQVNAGDELRLEGIREYNEFARIDYVEFVPVSAPMVKQVAETAGDDFIQAGEGNDTVYGGEGNDTLYGDVQGDNSSSLLGGAQTYNGHTYLLSSFGTWAEAQADAKRLGGNLLTLNDAAEEAWIKSTFGTQQRFFIGINDQRIEGQFEWVSGEAVTYTNWAPGEPNNSGGSQDFGTINFSATKQWDDVGSGVQRFGIIEIETTDSDVLVGGSGDDTIYGNSGDDQLYGDDFEQTPGSLLSSSSLNDGLVAHWAFDETTGTQAGDAMGNHFGTLVNMSNTQWISDDDDDGYSVSLPTNSQWVDGQEGGALDFDGTNDRVMVADSAELDITETLTLATWVNADAFSSWAGLIIKGTSNISYALEISSNGRLIFDANYAPSRSLQGAVGSETFYSNESLTVGQWQHVVVTYDGSNVQFYIDGQLDSSHQASIRFGTSNEALVIGGDLAGGSHFNGALDEVKIYDRALDSDEVIQLATGQTMPQPVGEVIAESGNDSIFGGIGSDTLEGGGGNDVLDGSDAIAAGYLERDILSGGSGSDTFVVGNATQAYYLGGGDRDYVTIQDFNAAEDAVQLYGSVGDYRQQQVGSDTHLFYQGNTSELIAVFKNVTDIDLNNGFTFV
ncbi:MAG: NF038122 family metalloprotease [Cyanobacteria bacterium P01_D01_bin.105]